MDMVKNTTNGIAFFAIAKHYLNQYNFNIDFIPLSSIVYLHESFNP
jgi:hypothetical protein